MTDRAGTSEKRAGVCPNRRHEALACESAENLPNSGRTPPLGLGKATRLAPAKTGAT